MTKIVTFDYNLNNEGLIMAKGWNNKEITSQCRKTRAERRHKFETKRSMSDRLKDEIKTYLKNGGVIKLLPPCVCQIDPVTNKPLLRVVK